MGSVYKCISPGRGPPGAGVAGDRLARWDPGTGTCPVPRPLPIGQGQVMGLGSRALGGGAGVLRGTALQRPGLCSSCPGAHIQHPRQPRLKVPSPQGHTRTDDTQRAGESTAHSLGGERQAPACPFSISEVELITLCPVSKEGRD